MKKNKISIEKFRILKLTNSSFIKGGTGDSNYNTTTNYSIVVSQTVPSADTTFTTDPDVACPETLYSDTSHTSGDGTNGGVIPTINSTIPRIP